MVVDKLPEYDAELRLSVLLQEYRSLREERLLDEKIGTDSTWAIEELNYLTALNNGVSVGG